MKYRKLNLIGKDVSVICMGAWSISTEQNEYWGAQDETDSIQAIHAAFDFGINFFDTAEAYGGGNSEELLGRALGPRRKNVVIATKISSHRPDIPTDARRACEASLRRLQTDYIDLYQIHWPHPSMSVPQAIDTLDALRREGKIRAIGVSNFGVSYLEDIPDASAVVSNQLPYGLLWRVIENGILPMSMKKGLGILAYSPLLQGLLTGKFRSPQEVPEGRKSMRLLTEENEGPTFQAVAAFRAICERIGRPMAEVALAWVLAQPGVVSAIAGSRNARQSLDNARAGDLELPPDIIDELNRISDDVKTRMGDNADMWVPESRMEKSRVPAS